MDLSNNIDLHMHTTISDGTDTPAGILRAVKDAGIKIFSVTDHDAIDACIKIRNDLARECSDLIFINGVEFSCRDDGGKYHILGYGYDLLAKDINLVTKEAHDIRMEKLNKRLIFLKEEFSFEFSDSETESLKKMNNPGKPHIARIMVEKGYAKDIDDAINNYMNKRRFTNYYIKPDQAIDAIIKSGGIPVLAHPSFGDGDQLITGGDMDNRLSYLKAMGLEGVEAYYSGFSEKLENEMLDFADKYDLYVTCGSDYHGDNKLVRLNDTNLTPGKTPSFRLKKFLDAVSK